MFRPILRVLPSASIHKSAIRSVHARRFINTASPHKTSRTWKSSAARWGLAGALVYYYNSGNVFAEVPAYALHAPPETNNESETYATIDSISAQRRTAQPRSQPTESTPSSSTQTVATSADAAALGSPGDLEEEAEQQGAFNEETGEINWDCPCLGGMADGPCGEQFREAFSCFVFSKEEPKGVDCIEKFKGMQNCFQEHPDLYGAELDEEEMEAQLAEDESGGAAPAATAVASEPAATSEAAASVGKSSTPASEDGGKGEKVADVKPSKRDPEPVIAGKRQRAEAAKEQVQIQHGTPTSESDEMVPKAWHDARTDDKPK